MTCQPTLKQLAAFVAAVNAGSLRRAAELTGTSQPSVSAQIAGLEAVLGVRLLERRATGVLPTPAGRQALDRARRVLEAVEAVMALREAGERQVEGTVMLGISSSIGPYLVPATVTALADMAPGLDLSVREGAARRLTEALLAGEHDLVVTQLPVFDEAIETMALFEERLFLMLAEAHPLAAREAIPLPALAGERVLTLGPEFALTRQVVRICAEVGALVTTAYEGASLDALRIMCRAGDAVAFAPELYVRSEVRPCDTVVARPIAGRALSRTVVLAWRRSQGEMPFVWPVAEALRQAARREERRQGEAPAAAGARPDDMPTPATPFLADG